MRLFRPVRFWTWTAVLATAFLFFNCHPSDTNLNLEDPPGGGEEPGDDDSGDDDTGFDYANPIEDPVRLYALFYDVHLGDAALYEVPGPYYLLIDGGPVGNGEFTICPDLQQRGIEWIDVMVMTHPDYDHCGGLAEIFDCAEVGEVWTNGEVSEQEDYLRFEQALEAWGGLVSVKEEGDQADLGGLHITVLHSASGYPDNNNNSMVLMLEYMNKKILTTADIDFEAQEELALGYGPDLRCDIIKIPSHGHAPFSQAFVDLLDSQLAVLSVGPNEMGYPAQETIDAYLAAGMELYRTDEDGNIRIVLDGGPPIVYTQR